MKSTNHNNVTWIDLENPNSEDIRFLQENFEVHPLAIEEFATPTYRARATRYSNCLFLTIHIPLFDKDKRTTYAGEIDILLTKTHLITGHQRKIYQLTNFFDKLQNSIGKRRIYMSDTPAHLLYEIFNLLTESCFPRLDHVTQNIDETQEGIFSGNEKGMVREISVIKRDVLNFRRTLMPQRTIVESIIHQGKDLVPQELRPYFQDLIGTNIRLWNMLESAKETITSLEETNNSLLSHKINSKMRIITIFSATIIPVTLYANILSINVITPFSDHPYGLFIHLGIMFCISLLTFSFFKFVKWE
ncbi:MAG: magnesium transporter CorA family protein [Candidatus Moranbacteria bacterium]|nr:magnesium transporter CorA family protein [Candidatus Moranbacteria bacterium]